MPEIFDDENEHNYSQQWDDFSSGVNLQIPLKNELYFLYIGIIFHWTTVQVDL